VSATVIAVGAYLLLGPRPAPGGAPAVAVLPLVNACLNATSAALLTLGYVFIRRKQVTAHKTCMVSALTVSTLFLVSYVTYHALAGSRPFTGRGVLRLVYFPLLVSHIVLAAAIVPLALTPVSRGRRPGAPAPRRRAARPGRRQAPSCRAARPSRGRGRSGTSPSRGPRRFPSPARRGARRSRSPGWRRGS